MQVTHTTERMSPVPLELLKMSRCQRWKLSLRPKHFYSLRLSFTVLSACDLLNTPLARSAIAGPAPISRLLETGSTREHGNEMKYFAMDRSRLPSKRFVHYVLGQAT